MKHYYILFDMTANINYNYLISLYDIAEYNITDKCYNIINYNTLKQIANSINVSPKTLNKILSTADYQLFITHDKTNKQIIINNNFSNSRKHGNKFVMLTDNEIKVLKKQGDNLLYKYFIYIKYFCGFAKNKQQDFTAKQFLNYCGYSDNSNNYISKLSEYNKILTDNKLLRIEKYKNNLGYTRNIYFIYP